MISYKEMKNQIIDMILGDSEYAKFLCGQDLTDENIADIICSAPVSLYRKLEALRDLIGYCTMTNNGDFFKAYYEELNKALSALKLKEDEIFLLVGKTREYGGETQFEAFPSRSFEKIRNYVNSGECDKETCDYWYELEKWRNVTDDDKYDPDFDNDMIDDYVYTFVYGELCYFTYMRDIGSRNSDEARIREKFSIYFSGMSLNLPTPFKVGDILEVAATPFAPKKKVLVISNSPNKDCCHPCCLFFGKESLQVGALKHSHIYKEFVDKNISPLFVATIFKGELKDSEMVFKVVSDYVKVAPAKGEEIFELMLENNRVSPEALIDYITRKNDN